MYKPRGVFMRNPDLVPAYLRPGMWGWILHRVTGLLILFYLLLHIWVIGRAAVSPQAFDAIMVTLGTPFWRVLEVGLLACVLYHGINGIRIILFDLGYGIRVHRAWWYATMAVVVVLFVIGAVNMLMPLFAAAVSPATAAAGPASGGTALVAGAGPAAAALAAL